MRLAKPVLCLSSLLRHKSSLLWKFKPFTIECMHNTYMHIYLYTYIDIYNYLFSSEFLLQDVTTDYVYCIECECVQLEFFISKGQHLFKFRSIIVQSVNGSATKQASSAKYEVVNFFPRPVQQVWWKFSFNFWLQTLSVERSRVRRRRAIRARIMAKKWLWASLSLCSLCCNSV